MKSLREYIQDAEERSVAVGHFNISNLEALHAVCTAAKTLQVPVIIGLSEGERSFVGIHEAVALVRTFRDVYKQPVFLNADHTYTVEGVQQAIDAGFDAVIFDGTKYSDAENIAMTRACVAYARASGRDVLVEAELGNIGQSSKVLDALPEGVRVDDDALTTVEQAITFVQQTGVDLLAPAIGNIHGMLRVGHDPRLNIQRIEAIHQAVGIPLVLHGGSGTVDADFVQAIQAGMAVVHINTEIRVAFKNALQAMMTTHPDEIAPYKLLAPSVEAMQQQVLTRLKLFNGIK